MIFVVFAMGNVVLVLSKTMPFEHSRTHSKTHCI